MSNYDQYFLKIAGVVASRSKCLSRQLGAVLVKDGNIISTGYNGPPRGIPHCEERNPNKEKVCPRKLLGHKSGTKLELCPAVHAEKNCLISAAKHGISTNGASMYLNATITPCSQCYGAMINAGIKEVVVVHDHYYDELVGYLIRHGDLIVRKYKL